MRSKRLLLFLLCALVVAAVVPAVAWAAFYNSRSTSADAWWSTWNWDNPTEPGPNDAITEWNVSGNIGAGVARDAGTPISVMKSTTAWASMSSYTPATADEPRIWTSFICFSESPLLTFGKALSSADLQYTAEGTLSIWKDAEPWIQTGDEEWELRDPDEQVTEVVDVEADWKATGALSKSMWVNRDKSEDYFWADRSQQSTRRASATLSAVGASGMVYSADLPPAVDAQISQGKSVGRYNGEWF